MDRTLLMELGKKHGYKPGKKPDKTVKDKIEAELRSYFNSPEGKQALKKTPKVFRGDGSCIPMTAEYAVEALLEEFS